VLGEALMRRTVYSIKLNLALLNTFPALCGHGSDGWLQMLLTAPVPAVADAWPTARETEYTCIDAFVVDHNRKPDSKFTTYTAESVIPNTSASWTAAGLMPGFHHSVAVHPLPFCRSAVVKFRCSVKIT